MNQDQFVARRQEQWQELGHILDEVGREGLRQLPPLTVQRVGRLYRQTASDLAYARTYFPNSPTGEYLNLLVARAHSLVYAEEPRRLRRLWRFLAAELPGAVRAAWRPLLLAAAFMLAGGLLGFFAILNDPNLAEAFVPEQFREFVAAPRSGEIFPVGGRPLIGTLIMLNNIWVGILAYALGITLGLGTALVLLQNGLIIGALAGQFYRAGLSYAFWSLIVPHGVVELLAIFLCGAAGLSMGWSIVTPGELTRRAALARAARQALRLLAGAVPFFVVAAAIEGWVTPMTSLSAGGKYLVGGVTGLLALAYWALPGRHPKSAPGPSAVGTD